LVHIGHVLLPVYMKLILSFIITEWLILEEIIHE